MSPVHLPTSRKAIVTTRIYEAVRSTFAHWEAVPNYDLDREFAAYLDEALVASDRFAFDLATLRFVAGLTNGHTASGDNWS